MSKKNSDEFARFQALSEKVLSVSKSEILRREATYKEQVALKPNRRGPKRKLKPSSVPSPAAS